METPLESEKGQYASYSTLSCFESCLLTQTIRSTNGLKYIFRQKKSEIKIQPSDFTFDRIVLYFNQLNVTRKHSSMMCTAHFSSSGGVAQPPWMQTPTPGCRLLPLDADYPVPWMQTVNLMDADAIHLDADPQIQTLNRKNSPPPVNRMTDMCKKHYLALTSFAGSKHP